MIVREKEDKDSGAVYELLIENLEYHKSLDKNFKNFINKYEEAVLEQIELESRTYDCIVAEINSTIAACLLYKTIDGETAMYDIYVQPSFRGKSIGKKMFKHLLSLTSGNITLRCLVKNETALSFYKSLGFEIVELDEKSGIVDYILVYCR